MNKRRRERRDGIAKTVHHFLERRKCLVEKAAQTDSLPDLFNRIHLRSVGRKVTKVNIGRNHQSFGFVPGSAVAAKDDLIVRKSPGQLLQEQIHADSITVGKNQEAGLTGQGLHRAKGIAVFPDVMTGDTGTDTLFTPAVSGLVDPAKARLILKHKTDIFPFCFSRFSYFFHKIVNFFEDSISSSPAFFGCRLRGITFRHPCRFSTR